MHLDTESSRGRLSLRTLVPALDKVHGGSNRRVLSYGQEMNDWAAHPLPEGNEPVLSADDAMLGLFGQPGFATLN